MDLRNIFGLFNVKPFASAVIASGTSTTVVTGVAGKRIYVYAYKFTMSAAGTFKFQTKPSGAAVDLEGAQTFDANGGACEQDPRYLFKTAVGDSLIVAVSAGNANGRVSYWIE